MPVDNAHGEHHGSARADDTANDIAARLPMQFRGIAPTRVGGGGVLSFEAAWSNADSRFTLGSLSLQQALDLCHLPIAKSASSPTTATDTD